MPSTTRGPLPPAVYWRRRLFVLGLAACLVFLVTSLLRGGSDGSSDDPPAARQAGNPVPTATVTATETGPSDDLGRSGDAGEVEEHGEAGEDDRKKGKRKDQPAPLAQPDGPCDPADVVVDPVVKNAVAGRPVTIGLWLRTVESEACTWEVSAKTVTLKITDGSQDVWTTLHCPRPLPQEPVVVRKAVRTLVELEWNARYSDDGCPRLTDWAEEGDYTITAAALGGEPTESTFDLANPTPETVTASPEPEQGGTEKPGQQQTGEPIR